MSEVFAEICRLDNLRQAWECIRRKGARGGLDGVSVGAFGNKAEAHLEEIAADLYAGRYRPEPAQRLHVPKFNVAGDFRPLSLPAIKDKIVQMAVKLALEPLVEPRFLDCSYAYRPGKGPRKAVNRVSHYLTHEKKTWVLFGDLDNFFDSLNHDRLLAEVGQIVAEPQLLHLLALWLKSGAMDARGRYHDMDLGIAQGSVISPILSNIYAHPLDKQLLSRQMAYVRYADNFVALFDTEAQAREGLAVIVQFLREGLGLQLNPEKNPIRSLDQGFVFLGVFFRGQECRLAQEKVDKLRRKLDWLTHTRSRRSLDQILSDLTGTITGVRRYYGFLKPWPQFQELDQNLQHRLKVLLSDRRRQGEFGTQADLLQRLQILEFLAPANPEVQTKARKRLACQVFRPATPPSAPPKVPPPPNASPLLPGPPAPVQPPAGQNPPHNSVKPEVPEILAAARQQVAAKKRQYVRRHYLESEVVVHSPGIVLGQRQQRLVLSRDRKKVMDRPLIKVKSILINSRGVSLSTDLIEACAQADIPLVFSEPSGRVYAMLHAPAQCHPDLGLLQLQALTDGRALECAKLLILGKIKNQVNLMKFYLRARQEDNREYVAALREMEDQLQGLTQDIVAVSVREDADAARQKLMGLEGQAATGYWALVRRLLPVDAAFHGRVRQGATDLVNAALNYGYGMLYPRVVRALLLAGLNLQIGFLHAPQPGKPTLSYDLIEPFRPPVVDRAVFSLFTRDRKLALTTEKRLTAQSVRLIVGAVLGRLGTLVPYRGKKITLEDVIHQQARLLAQSLRGEAKFKPFISRY